jgi:hypothetical protein
MALPKLGPTGKKIAIGAAVAGGLTLAGIAISKNAEQKRVLAAEEDMKKKYPFSENCLEMQHIYKTAKLTLAQLEAESGGDAGAKRVRARNTAALKKRIIEIEKYIPNLDCSQAVLAPDGLPEAAPAQTSNVTKYLLYGVAGIILLVIFSNLMKKKD